MNWFLSQSIYIIGQMSNNLAKPSQKFNFVMTLSFYSAFIISSVGAAEQWNEMKTNKSYDRKWIRELIRENVNNEHYFHSVQIANKQMKRKKDYVKEKITFFFWDNAVTLKLAQLNSLIVIIWTTSNFIAISPAYFRTQVGGSHPIHRSFGLRFITLHSLRFSFSPTQHRFYLMTVRLRLRDSLSLSLSEHRSGWPVLGFWQDVHDVLLSLSGSCS